MSTISRLLFPSRSLISALRSRRLRRWRRTIRFLVLSPTCRPRLWRVSSLIGRISGAVGCSCTSCSLASRLFEAGTRWKPAETSMIKTFPLSLRCSVFPRRPRTYSSRCWIATTTRGSRPARPWAILGSSKTSIKSKSAWVPCRSCSIFM